MSGLVTWLNLARLMIRLDFKYETSALMLKLLSLTHQKFLLHYLVDFTYLFIPLTSYIYT